MSFCIVQVTMEARSPNQESVASGTKASGTSHTCRSKGCKEFLLEFADSNKLNHYLENWLFRTITENSSFNTPFELIDLQKFDYAVEGISFQQLIRMPNAVYASSSDAAEATAFLAMEDFLHASAKGLWEAFWSQDEPMPFSVASLRNCSSKFYPSERLIASGKLGDICASAIMLNSPRHPQGKWDHILELVLLRPGLWSFSGNGVRQPSLSVLAEALFYALRLLLSRTSSRLHNLQKSNSVFILLADSKYGGIVKVEGDLSKLILDASNVYECAAEWIKVHSRLDVSPFDRIWNELGNANWGDIGALQALFATFHCIMQFAGPPKTTIEDLAADHSTRLQARRMERELGCAGENGDCVYRSERSNVSPEIIEVQEATKLSPGSILWVDDSNWQKGYQITEVLRDGETIYYIAYPVEDAGKALYLHVGSHLSRLDASWKDTNSLYQVQRQTKVLNVMKQKGLSSRYLPQLNASGRMVHPGECRKQNTESCCDHPWCGTPILVTSPVGETVTDLVNDGRFGTDEALRCCHDCLSALSTAASAGIRHGDIRPENVIFVRRSYFVVIGWGHAVLDERDRPAMNLHFSSTLALEEPKLCSSSDAESLVYLLYFSCGGELPVLDSVEGALQWREKSLSTRLIQRKLGDVSMLLKAFADYVNSLCSIPYGMDYEIWLRRLRREIHQGDRGKEVGTSG